MYGFEPQGKQAVTVASVAGSSDGLFGKEAQEQETSAKEGAGALPGAKAILGQI